NDDTEAIAFQVLSSLATSIAIAFSTSEVPPFQEMSSIMLEALQSPAQTTYWLISGRVLFLIINLLGLACFAYIVTKRLTPLIQGERDFRFDRPFIRLERVLQFWLGQWKHPRYRIAGTIHILIFAGFILLATRAFSLLIIGISENFVLPSSSGGIGHIYEIIADYAASMVFLCMIA